MAEYVNSTDESGEASPASTIDIHVLSLKECFVFKVPPLRSASGHRAEDWGLENPLFTGCIKMYQNDERLRILVFKYTDQTKLAMIEENMVFFAECPVVVKPGENVTNFVDAVVDSSRYYVLRIKDPRSDRSTLLGIGFRERETAFDFKNTLNEYVRYIDRLHRATRGRGSSVGSSGGEEHSEEEHTRGHGGVDHHASLMLKEGEKIKVSIRLKKDHHAPSGSEEQGQGVPKQLLSLRVPPPGGVIGGVGRLPPPSSGVQAVEKPGGGEEEAEDEWGDFTSS